MTSQSTIDLLRHLASKPGHDEVKAGFWKLLIDEFGAELSALDFERRVPVVRGRLDALIGRTVFEAKRDLAKELGDVERKMPDYLADCEREEGEKFVGIASDGRQWIAYELEGGKLIKIKEIILDLQKPELFLAWLDGVVALKISLPPDPLTIRIELGQDSVAFRRAGAALAGLWGRLGRDAAVALKRQLWAQLLKLVYGREVESDALWFQHTFLVIVAKCIALSDTMQVIDHMLYWAAVLEEREASFLTALFNSETTRLRVESVQSRGQWGARHFDKVMFNLPIPRFDATDPLHNAIADAAREAEALAASVPLPENIKFQRARGLIRAALIEAGVAQRIDALVARFLDAV